MKCTILPLLAFFSVHCNAQISGTVLDDKGNKLDLVTVSLTDLSDSTMVAADYTTENGEFMFLAIEAGVYKLEADRIGFDSYQIEFTYNTGEVLVLKEIFLTANSESLEQAEVVAEVPYIQREIDRIIVNPQVNIDNAGSSALEVLERTPGITVDDNGTISLKGRAGVAIFINDKPSYLSGSELENYLRSLPAESIKRIEIMENPPAKYDAAGNSGVINIILERNTLKGFYGSFSVSYRKGITNGSNNSLNLNYNRKKLGLYANLGVGFWNGLQDLFINRYTLNAGEQVGAFNQNTYILRSGEYLHSKVGADFYVSDRTTLGASFQLSSNPSTRDNDNTSLVSDGLGNLEQRVVADNITDVSFISNVYSVYWLHKLDTLGSQITIDGDHVTYNSANVQSFQNFIYSPDDILTFNDLVNGDIPSTIDIWAARADYSKPLKKGALVEAGAKFSSTNTDNEAIYSTTIDDITTPNLDLSNRFLYDEQISAAYLNYKRSLGKVTIQAGLRAEHTELTGEQVGNAEQPDSTFTRDFTSLFPTFYSSVPLDSLGSKSIVFSYGRRIDRPYYQDLNPFVSPLDRFTFYSGNPDLVPTFAHKFSLSYAHKGMFNATASYSKTVDGIMETLEIRDGIYYSRPGNIASNQSMSLALDANLKAKKVYSINAYAELGHLIFDSPLFTQQLNSRGTYVYAQATNNFDLGKGWKASLTGRYSSDRVLAQLELEDWWTMSLGLQKRIMNDKGLLRANLSDVFYTRVGNGVINNLENTLADWNSQYDSRSLRISFSYNFGSATGNKNKHESNGSGDEQNRVRG